MIVEDFFCFCCYDIKILLSVLTMLFCGFVLNLYLTIFSFCRRKFIKLVFYCKKRFNWFIEFCFRGQKRLHKPKSILNKLQVIRDSVISWAYDIYPWIKAQITRKSMVDLSFMIFTMKKFSSFYCTIFSMKKLETLRHITWQQLPAWLLLTYGWSYPLCTRVGVIFDCIAFESKKFLSVDWNFYVLVIFSDVKLYGHFKVALSSCQFVTLILSHCLTFCRDFS